MVEKSTNRGPHRAVAAADDAGGKGRADDAVLHRNAHRPGHRPQRLQRDGRQRTGRLHPEHDRSGPDQRHAEDRGRAVAAAHSAHLRTRHHPWLSHVVPDSAGTVGFVESGVDRARCPPRGAGGQPRRHSLDVFADGRHRSRCALGPHCGRRGRRSLSRIGHCRRLRAWISGREPEQSRLARRLRQTFRGLWRRRRRARLQHGGDPRTAAAPGVSAAVRSCGTRRCSDLHERLRSTERSSVDRERFHAENRSAR